MDSNSKAIAILEATKNGDQLSPRDLDIVRVAQSIGLSPSGYDELDALYDNVTSGAYLDPESDKFPNLQGIKYLTHDHQGNIRWRGAVVGHLAFNDTHREAEVVRVRQLAAKCLQAEAQSVSAEDSAC